MDFQIWKKLQRTQNLSWPPNNVTINFYFLSFIKENSQAQKSGGGKMKKEWKVEQAVDRKTGNQI